MGVRAWLATLVRSGVASLCLRGVTAQRRSEENAVWPWLRTAGAKARAPAGVGLFCLRAERGPRQNALLAAREGPFAIVCVGRLAPG